MKTGPDSTDHPAPAPGPGDAPPRVVVYTTSWCPSCARAKDLLRRRGIEFREVDGEKEWGGAFRDEIFRRTGGMTVPQIVIDGKAVGGYADLLELDESGGLKALAAR